ncbi:S-methyl-5-thioribose-1-phosphate isomerase [Desulfovibrio piger]|uniref:S-methyl-5-thioribose-1-phosphate isomerase n=1 Tax=Desulfovibrio piger TaxID=901 RepID=UPI003EFD0A90
MEHHIRFDADAMTLYLLDQRALPGREDYLPIRTLDETIRALQVMVVRGAPAIGVTAGFGCVLALEELRRGLPAGADWRMAYDRALVRLEAARPTAVNLRWGVERMRALWQAHAGLEMEELIPVLLAEAETMRREDVEICREIGRHGASCINDGDTVLTHCNAGALATAGYGTALGVIRGALEAGKKVRVIADETRPFLQGARLTAWELQQDGIDVRVACDNACALLMQKGLVQCVVVGADRIAANGDAANKIGTFGVALLAKHFGIPFYVAAPLSTIDPRTPDGAHIPIEERPDREVTHVGETRIVPEGVPVFNFAFDVTPADCITGIITEKGVLRAPYGPAIAAALKD